MRKLILGTIFVSIGLSAAGTGIAQDDAADRIDQLFLSWSKSGAPGAAVAVVREGKPWIAKGYGTADLERGIPLGSRTPLNVASLAKQFTAFAVLELQANGRLSLDDAVRKHIPELPDFGRPLTIRHLLFHTSGLRDWVELRRMAGGSMEDAVTASLVLKLVCAQRELNFAPGTEYAYSNVNYILLAEIVARTSGRSFKDFLAAAVFSPLNMDTAFVRDEPKALPEGMAVSYRRARDGRFTPAVDNEAAPGPGALFLSAEDMSRWMAAFCGGTIGSPDVRAIMSRPGNTTDGGEVPYAAGLIPDRYKGLPILTHSGGWAGYQAYMILIPSRKFAVAVLANHAQIDAAVLSRRIVEIGLDGDIPAAPAPPAPVAVAGPDLDACVGRYWLGGEQMILISRNDDRLFVQFSGDATRELAAESADTFLLPLFGVKLRFHRSGAEKADRLTLFRSADAQAAERIPDDQWTPADLSEFSGRYQSPELGFEIEIKLGEKGLFLPYPQTGDLLLSPAAKDRFAGKGTLAKITFIRGAAGNVSEFRFTFLGARNVRFVRATRSVLVQNKK